MSDTAPGFEDFWLASELNSLRLPGFASRLTTYQPAQRGVSAETRAGDLISLGTCDNALVRLLAERHSSRTYTGQGIPIAQLGQLLSVAAEIDGHRGHAAGGGLYTVGISVLCLNIVGPTNAMACQYVPTHHALVPVAASPGWPELSELFGAQSVTGAPAAVLVLWSTAAQALAKYGERGGRFVLLEAGALLQSLGLGAAHLGLGAVILGGGNDREVLNLIGLTGLPAAKYVAAMAVGCAEATSPREML
ncbi:MAG: nitroreductase family protein [Arachnia sp.]